MKFKLIQIGDNGSVLGYLPHYPKIGDRIQFGKQVCIWDKGKPFFENYYQGNFMIENKSRCFFDNLFYGCVLVIAKVSERPIRFGEGFRHTDIVRIAFFLKEYRSDKVQRNKKKIRMILGRKNVELYGRK